MRHVWVAAGNGVVITIRCKFVSFVKNVFKN